jgi:hypothetical protein
MSQETVLSLEDIENQDFMQGKDAKEKVERTPFLPVKGQNWPINLRILVNPVATELGRPVHEANVHPIQVNGKWVNIPCPRTLGKRCYMCDKRWNAIDELKQLEAIGAKAEGHPENGQWRKYYAISETYKQKRQSIFLAALPNDPKVYMFYAGPALVNAIFGDKRKNIPGALHEIKEYGVSLFSPSQPSGWLSLNKTGQKLDTVYTAKALTKTVVEGKSKVLRLHEEMLHEDIQKLFEDPTKLPRILESYKGRMWSEEEIQAFVDSEATILPERIARFYGGNKDADHGPTTETEDFSRPSSFDTGAGEMDPF